jgi:hypothetical protein
MAPSLDYPPETLRQYALLADGERGAVVGPRGDVAFLCAPRWHDPAVFSSLIGGAGLFAVTPEGRYVWGGHYEPDSLIWRSRWVTEDGIVECREALARPADPTRVVLLRRIEAHRGDARVQVVLDPRADFGRHDHDLAPGGRPDVWEGRSGPLRVRWWGVPEGARRTPDGVVGTVRLREGQSHDLLLEIAEGPLPDHLPCVETAWAVTESAWEDAAGPLPDSIAPLDGRHSLAVLRGLTSSTHGMVAAATMSLPERADTDRNYDYRYSWIRDQAFAGQAAATVGAEDLLHSASEFVAARLLDDGPTLKPAYTVDGGDVPQERSLSLAGYPGGTDKVGNWVTHQFQLDAFGESLLLLAAAAERGLLTPEHRRAALVAGDAIARRRHDPDAGIWELGERPWTHSRLICAAGLRQFARACPEAATADWAQRADRIVEDTSRTSLHPTGRWQRAPDLPGVDAALLLPALRGALPADDPRSLATLRAVREDLSQDGFVYRFRHGDQPLHEAEGAFLLCGFHMAMATHEDGDQVAAVRWFERNRSAVGPPGLLTEEFDVVQRQLRGNLPQAFVHAAQLEAGAVLARPVH